MTIRELQIFIAVAETGRMGEAAKRLYISQPTVSKVIADIEEHYGLRLFERLSRKLYITEPGQKLLGYARHITALFEEMERDLRDSSTRLSLKVGATNTVGRCFLAQVVRQFEQENPNRFTEVFVDNTRQIEERILASELDLAVVEGEITSPELLVRAVAQDELVLICGAGHPFASRSQVRLEELAGQPFVMREQGSGTRERLEQQILDRGISISPKWICRSSDSILAAVAQNQGLSLISHLVARQVGAGMDIHILGIEGEDFHRTFNLIYHKNKFLSQAIRDFISLLERMSSPKIANP